MKGQGDRAVWIDMARGSAILLVIIFHASSRLRDLGYDIPEVITGLSNAVAPFRIPMLMFLSGMFLPRSLLKGVWLHIYGKIIHIAWPYALWLLIFCAAGRDLAAYLDPTTWKGGSYLWYMGFLFAFYLIAIPLMRVPPIVSALYFYALAALLPDLSPIQQRFLVLLAYFFLGAQAAIAGPRFEALLRSRWPLVFVPLLIGMAVASAMVGDIRYAPMALPVSIVCIGVLLSCFIRVQYMPGSAMLAHIGRRSIIYYVVHLPAIILLQDTLVGLPGVGISTIILLSLIVGLAAPAALDFASARIPALSILFQFPDVCAFFPLGGRTESQALQADAARVVHLACEGDPTAPHRRGR